MRVVAASFSGGVMGLEWVRVDSARILAIMPVELVGLYDKWVR